MIALGACKLLCKARDIDMSSEHGFMQEPTW